MEMKHIQKERIDEYKEFIIERIKIFEWDTPTAIASRAWYRGFKEFRFDEARAMAEKVKQIYLAHVGKKKMKEIREMIFI